MSEKEKKKECEHHKGKKRRLFVQVFWCLIVFIFIVLLTILIIWAVLRPSKPSFLLQDVTVFAFNATTPNFLTSSFQVTLISRNPNDRIGVYYDRLEIYASYRSQQITYRTAIPPTYQSHKEINIWSPFVFGNNIPVAPFIFDTLASDQTNGLVAINVRADGKVRFKVGAFNSGRYNLHIRCRAIISFGPRKTGVVVEQNVIKFQVFQPCSVSL
ncbi:hypothetical protein VNO78_21120 [Psophocarpus tetragonolobus]|uniref:Late embryogenesis abundant protein LEA-2 subgroup domain-containing protein n=1 Tax=Psophocarpus tetragonolobus TaxID=3891 RepID=A0AAN9XHW2_PSOTE